MRSLVFSRSVPKRWRPVLAGAGAGAFFGDGAGAADKTNTRNRTKIQMAAEEQHHIGCKICDLTLQKNQTENRQQSTEIKSLRESIQQGMGLQGNLNAVFTKMSSKSRVP